MFVNRPDCIRAALALIWFGPAGIHLLPGLLAAAERRGGNEFALSGSKIGLG